MHAYNLFRHRGKQDLVCAVPEDRAVPGFIAEKASEFDRKVTELAAAPMGFDASAATTGPVGERVDHAQSGSPRRLRLGRFELNTDGPAQRRAFLRVWVVFAGPTLGRTGFETTPPLAFVRCGIKLCSAASDMLFGVAALLGRFLPDLGRPPGRLLFCHSDQCSCRRDC